MTMLNIDNAVSYVEDYARDDGGSCSSSFAETTTQAADNIIRSFDRLKSDRLESDSLESDSLESDSLESDSLKGDCFESDSSAFDSLPRVIQEAMVDAKRVVFIANNPAISTKKLKEVLNPDDVLVLFNHFIHAEFLTTHPIIKSLPKLIFFRQIGDSQLHFGLPPRSNNMSYMEQMAKSAPLGLLFSNIRYQFPTPDDDPKPEDDPIEDRRILVIPEKIKAMFDSDSHHKVLSENHRVVADYPRFEDIHSSAPSSGFLLFRLMLAVRAYLQSTFPDNDPLELLMIGFNHNEVTNHFWHGHNWEFERQEINAAPPGVTVIRQ